MRTKILISVLSTILFLLCTNDIFSHTKTIGGNVAGYVDLGLNSRTLWATHNLGATKPEECGAYLSWADLGIEEEGYHNGFKRRYSKSTLKYYEYNDGLLTKYVTNIGKGKLDDNIELTPDDDAATFNWGDDWCLPSKEQLEELLKSCYWCWTDSYNGTGVRGYIVYKVKSSHDMNLASFVRRPSAEYSLSDTHIFLPFTGDYMADQYEKANSFYWTKSINTYNCWNAWALRANNHEIMGWGCNRCYGFCIRPVRVNK